jgi:DegV family protein with EDD domain
MSKIAVVTDSVAIIPEDLVKLYDIHVAPCHVIWDKVKYLDGVDIKAADFYKRLRKSSTLPTTSSAIVHELVQIFEGLKGNVDGIVVIVLSGTLGAAYSSAMKAKEMFPDIPIEVIDTKIALMGEGFTALEATKIAKAGGNMEQVVKAARDTLAKMHVYYALDTFEYLRRGGRVSFSKSMIATILRVKPIMTFTEGKTVPISKPRTMSSAIGGLIDLMKEKGTGTPLHVSVMHGDNPKDAEKLKNKIDASFNYKEMIITEVTPIIGTHWGPGALGIAFYNE